MRKGNENNVYLEKFKNTVRKVQKNNKMSSFIMIFVLKNSLKKINSLEENSKFLLKTLSETKDRNNYLIKDLEKCEIEKKKLKEIEKEIIKEKLKLEQGIFSLNEKYEDIKIEKKKLLNEYGNLSKENHITQKENLVLKEKLNKTIDFNNILTQKMVPKQKRSTDSDIKSTLFETEDENLLQQLSFDCENIYRKESKKKIIKGLIKQNKFFFLIYFIK